MQIFFIVMDIATFGDVYSYIVKPTMIRSIVDYAGVDIYKSKN